MRDLSNETPLLTITFEEMPSWNNFLGMARHFGAAAGLMKKWRKAGRVQAIWHAERAGGTVERWTEFTVNENLRTVKIQHEAIKPFFFQKPVILILKFWRPDNRRYDTFSPFVKPIVDGFVDAGLIEDDSVKFIPYFGIEFGGIDPSLKPSKEALILRKAKRRAGGKSLLTPSRFSFIFYSV